MPFGYRVQHLLNIMAQRILMVKPPFFEFKTKKEFRILWEGVLIILDAQTISRWRPSETSSADYTHSNDDKPQPSMTLLIVYKESGSFYD